MSLLLKLTTRAIALAAATGIALMASADTDWQSAIRDRNDNILDRYDIDYPGLISFQVNTLNPRLTLSHLVISAGPRISYAFLRNFFATAGYYHGQAGADDEQVFETIAGVQASSGKVIPYAAIDNVANLNKRRKPFDIVNYLVGVSFNFTDYFAPTFEIDSFMDSERFFYAPQLLFTFAKRYQLSIEYNYQPSEHLSSMNIRVDMGF